MFTVPIYFEQPDAIRASGCSSYTPSEGVIRKGERKAIRSREEQRQEGGNPKPGGGVRKPGLRQERVFLFLNI